MANVELLLNNCWGSLSQVDICLVALSAKGISSQVITKHRQEVSSLLIHEIDLLQCFGILILIKLLLCTFAKHSQISAKVDWPLSF